MNTRFSAVPIAKNIWWVGAIDWAIRSFHGYATDRGSTYNAYLILDEKPTLIDTVKAPFHREMMERISTVINPADIRYIISNHSEMDHSGSLPMTIEAVKPERVIASTMGKKALAAHFHSEWGVEAVRDGDRIRIGEREITFIETRMLHWPDSMFSYLAGEQILFSNDAFGMHLASLERFSDELDAGTLEYEAKKYYANILLPYSDLVTKLFGRVRREGIGLSLIAPDHGPIWRNESSIARILGLWETWALRKPSRKAVVLYDTMWGSTDLMARAIADGLSAGGTEVSMLPLSGASRTDAATEIVGAGGLVVGSPTLNNEILPTLADALTYLKGLRPANLISAAFGSYGWSGESVAKIEQILAEMKLTPAGERVKALYVPDAENLAGCRDFGLSLAKKIHDFTLQG